VATLNVTKADFDTLVTSKDFMLVDLRAAWCGPCREFALIFEQAPEGRSELGFRKTDTEAAQELAALFDIMSIPTLMILRDRVVVSIQPGALSAPALGELIGNVRELDMAEVHRRPAETEAAS
jgi:thioredoxin 1